MKYAKKNLTFIKFKDGEMKDLVIHPTSEEMMPIVLEGLNLKMEHIDYYRHYSKGEIYLEDYAPTHWVEEE